jgi:hypothetical protein
LRSAPTLAKADPVNRTPGPAMSAVYMIVAFLAVLVALNIAEHGSAD